MTEERANELLARVGYDKCVFCGTSMAGTCASMHADDCPYSQAQYDYLAGAQQARCATCGTPLDGVSKHAKDCPYPAEEARRMRAMTPQELHALWGGGLRDIRQTIKPELAADEPYLARAPWYRRAWRWVCEFVQVPR